MSRRSRSSRPQAPKGAAAPGAPGASAEPAAAGSTPAARLAAFVPALILWSLVAGELWLSRGHYWWTQQAFFAHMTVVFAFIRWSGIAAAALALWSPARRAAERSLEAAQVGERWALLAASGGVLALIVFLKAVQYYGFQLLQDTADTGNLVHNLAYHGSFESTTLAAPSYLAIHFMPLVVVLAPLLRLWNDVRILILFQAAAIAAAPAAAYLLAARRSGSRLCGWACFWLVFVSPFFFNIVSANVAFQVILPTVFLWGAWCAETRRWKAAALCALALALTIEQTPVLFFGLGLYAALTLDRRGRLIGAAVCAGSAALFGAELAFMRHLPAAPVIHGGQFGYLAEAASRGPLAVAAAAFWPPEKLKPLWQLVASTGGACLLAPWEMVAWLVNLAPNLLSTGYYHDLRLHYAAYVVGPVWWGMALGLARAHGALARRGLASWLLVFALALGSYDFLIGPNVLLNGWGRELFSEGPTAAAAVPGGASLWAIEPVAARLGCRPYIKVLRRGADAAFDARLFVPDYVVLDRDWPRDVDAVTRRRVLGFLGQEGYVKALEDPKLVVLKNPRAPLEHGGAPPPLSLGEPDAKAAEALAATVERVDDYGPGVALMREAAERGDSQAQTNLGMVYERGLGVPRDEEQALRWWTAAAEQGEPVAATAVGHEYSERGDFAAAASWFKRAADAGDPEAMHDLGIFYLLGRGVPADAPQAAAWFRRAADRGFAPAQFNLAVLLADGRAGVRDDAQAAAWLEKAQASGYPQAAPALAALRRRRH